MATSLVLSVLLMFLIFVANPIDVPFRSQDLDVATEEMARANYFTFVMLINMSPSNQRIQGNITFLMPNDRMLSRVRIADDSVSSFLLRHSIPLPLLIDHLEHIPSGSKIPTSDPESLLDIENNGRRKFFLNNVKIISPNICTAGSSIRCHGIDGVLTFIDKPSLPPCSNGTVPTIMVAPPAVLSPPLPSTDPRPASPPEQVAASKKSGSSCICSLTYVGLSSLLRTSLLVSVVGLFL